MRSDHAHFRSLNAAIAKMQSEDYQTHERARQTYNTGQEGSKQDSDEKRSKKVYGKDGKVVHASLANMRRSLNKKNKKAAVAESTQSTEQRSALQEKIAKEIAEHLDKALGGVERMLLPAMQPDTKTRNEMREMQTDIKSIMRTLVGHWKL